MATFNNATKPTPRAQTKNHEGAAVYSLNPLEDLFGKVLGSFFGESTYYEKRDAASEFAKLQKVIDSVPLRDKEYVLKIAELGRLNNMIQYPLELLTVCLNADYFKGPVFSAFGGKNRMPYYFDQVVRRAKDINDIVATHMAVYAPGNGKKNFPKQMRVGINSKLENWDEFKLSKGLEKNAEVSLSDVIKLFRPNPKNNERRSKFFKEIMDGTVKVGNGKAMIQSELTSKGKSETKSNAGLTKAVQDDNLGNILKNLVNLSKNGVLDDPAVLNAVIAKFKDREQVSRSKILPIRFYSAYKEIASKANGVVARKLMDAIETAADFAVSNADNIEGFGIVLIDKSGSMDHPVSANSSVSATEMACLLGAIAFKKGNSDLFTFNNNCSIVEVSAKDTLFTIMRAALAGHGGGTNLKNALDKVTNYAVQKKMSYDYLLILSDNDCYGYSNGVLNFGERGWGYSVDKDSSANMQMDSMINRGIIKKVWLNNLLGNDFSIANTSSYRKNLITGFTESYVDIINIYNSMGTNADLRKVIDLYLDKCRSKNRNFA